MSFLKSRRMQMNLSQVKLAEMVKVSQQTVARWETTGQIPAKYLKDLAIITDSDIQDLMEIPVEKQQLTKGAVSRLLPIYAGRPLTEDEANRLPYGDVEVCFSNEAGGGSKFYPITAQTMEYIRKQTGDVGQGGPVDQVWVQFEALNNKWVALNTSWIDGLTFVDDETHAMTRFSHVEFYKAATELRRMDEMSDQELQGDDSPYSKTIIKYVAKYLESKSEEEVDEDLEEILCEFASGNKWSRTLSGEAAESLVFAFTQELSPRSVLELDFPDDGTVECLRLGSVRLLEVPLQKLENFIED